MPLTPQKVCTKANPIIYAPCEPKLDAKVQLKTFYRRMIIPAVKELGKCYCKCFKSTCTAKRDHNIELFRVS